MIKNIIFVISSILEFLSIYRYRGINNGGFMGGTDALLGFDYQISYALYRILLLAKENRKMVKSIKFE